MARAVCEPRLLIGGFPNNPYKTVQAMKDYTIIIERGEDGYLISEVLELPGCHTQAKTLDELMKRTREAIKIYVGTTAEEPAPSTFLGIQKLAV